MMPNMALKKLSCWEFMRCGREAGGENADKFGVCPAYPFHGQQCANVIGTFCDLVKVLQTSKHEDCQECPFYNSMHFDENAKRATLGKRI